MSKALKVNKSANIATATKARKPRRVAKSSTVPAAEPVGNFDATTGTFAPSADLTTKTKVIVAKPVRVTKKRVMYDLLVSGNFKAEQAADIMGITVIAARSLIGDLRRDGNTVTSSFTDKQWFYTIATK